MADHSTSRPKGLWLAITGAILQIFPAQCMISTIVRTVRAFIELGERSHSGVGDPSQLSALIGEALIAISVGMLPALVGAVLILVAVYFKRYRAPWLFWILLILGVMYLFALPLGTLIGLGFLIVAVVKRKEFLSPALP